jgi:2,4-dienoyl-CoA reductase-like NADH-dependent reductase (Old Yellow Enzyme family)
VSRAGIHWGSPLIIGGVRIQSRIGMAPLNTGLFRASADQVTRESFYRSFLSPHLGLLTIGGVAVHASGRANSSAVVLDNLSTASSLRSVVESAHNYGVPVAVQLEHAGRQARKSEIGSVPLAPSALPCPVVDEIPRALETRELSEVISWFLRASIIASQSGADFVEIHAAHGYLLSGFLSPLTNHRKDTYGGTSINRYRILWEIVEKIGTTVGIPVGVRINCWEHGEAGLTETDVIGGLLPFARNLAYVSVSAGMYSLDHDVIMPSRALGPALWREQAYAIRKALGLPILLAGNIADLETADDLITAGCADVVLLGRALLADPQLLQKSRSPESVQPCTDCGQCKYHSRGLPQIYCPFHPVLNPRRLRGRNSRG